MWGRFSGLRFRSIGFEDCVENFQRNLRWIIGCAFAGIVFSTMVAFLIEDSYQSVAVLRVVPQETSPGVFPHIPAQTVKDRAHAMAQTLTTRDTLSRLITSYGLYKNEQKRELLENVLVTMRDAIQIAPLTGQDFPSIKVQFSYRDRLLAHKVCEDLVSRLVSASTDDRLMDPVSAVAFLKEEYGSAKRRLDAADQKLNDYRIHHRGNLPAQERQNVQAMAELEKRLEERLSSATDAQTRSTEQRMMYETQLRLARNRLNTLNTAKERTEEQAEIDTMRAALSATKKANASLASDIVAVNRKLRAVQAHLAGAPPGENNYIELIRELETARQSLARIDEKLQLAKAAASGEVIGDTLELMEPASTPTTPTAPNRSLFILIGLAAGSALGLLLAAIREIRDTSLKNLKDARVYTNLSILVGVPLLENDAVVQRRRQLMWVGWATSAILGLAIMAGSVAHYYLTRT